MGQVHTPTSLALKLQSVIRDALENEISEKMVDIVKEHVEKDVYSVYDPVEYKRTGELKESLQRAVNSSNDGAEIIIDHDDGKMSYWSVVSKDFVDEQQMIPNAIEYGKIHPLFGVREDFHYLKPRPYMENSKEEILKKLDGLIVKAITKRLK